MNLSVFRIIELSTNEDHEFSVLLLETLSPELAGPVRSFLQETQLEPCIPACLGFCSWRAHKGRALAKFEEQLKARGKRSQ